MRGVAKPGTRGSIAIGLPYKARVLRRICNKVVLYIYRVSHELRSILQESVPYVKLYRYNPKHLYPKLNGYGDNDHRNVWASEVSTYCSLFVCPIMRHGNVVTLASALQ